MNTQVDKRSELLKAAEKLFLERGYNNVTLHDISEKSGVPSGNVYYYFKRKIDIAEALFIGLNLQDYLKVLGITLEDAKKLRLAVELEEARNEH